jgi:outer membrane scaffolding protein for murein synthesis (MipA/OmpV family)
MEVLVGIDAQYNRAIAETLSFIGGVNASLSNEKIGSYSESDYYAWGSRTMTQLTGGVAAGLEYKKDALTTFVTLGLQRSHLTHGKSASYTNNGAAGSNTDASGSATHRSATVGFNYAADNNMSILGTAGMSRASDGIKGSSVSLSANWQF